MVAVVKRRGGRFAGHREESVDNVGETWYDQFMETTTNTVHSREIVAAVSTALAELPVRTSDDDVLDCVYGQLQPGVFDAVGEEAIRRLIDRMR